MDSTTVLAAQKSQIDSLKWITLAITLIGISAWMAGEAFHRGYWHLAGWGGPIVPVSIQQTAYEGFVGTVGIWIYASLGIISCGIYLFFISAGPKKTVPAPAGLAKFVNWLRDNIHLDETTARLSGTLILSGFFCGIFVVVPLVLWVNAAGNAGQELFLKHICEMRNGKPGYSTVELSDGMKLKGRFLERTDKLSVILNKDFIHVVSIGEKPRLLDSTLVSAIPCPR